MLLRDIIMLQLALLHINPLVDINSNMLQPMEFKAYKQVDIHNLLVHNAVVNLLNHFHVTNLNLVVKVNFHHNLDYKIHSLQHKVVLTNLESKAAVQAAEISANHHHHHNNAEISANLHHHLSSAKVKQVINNHVEVRIHAVDLLLQLVDSKFIIEN